MSNSCIRIEADEKQINKCKELLHLQSERVNTMANMLSLAGNAARFNVLYLLHEEKRLCVCDLSDILGISISAVSQHLRKLKDRDLINSVKEGQTIFYSIDKLKTKLLVPFFTLLQEELKEELV